MLLFYPCYSEKGILISLMILPFLIVALAVYLYFEVRKIEKINYRTLGLIPVIAFFGALIYALRIDIEYLNHPQMVLCRTIGYCKTSSRQTGVEFEYSVNGEIYTKCVRPFSSSIDSVIVPNGIYPLKATAAFPKEARVDFTQLINDDK